MEGGGKVSYTFPLLITCKKGAEGVQIARKSVCVQNERPLILSLQSIIVQANDGMTGSVVVI